MSDFLRTVVTVVVHTPVWVWPLYALLLFLGVQRTRDSAVAPWRVLVLPAVVLLPAILSLVAGGLGAMPLAFVGLSVGSTIGWRLERDGDTRMLPDGRLWLRAEWLSLVQIVTVLVFRYSINVVPVISPGLNTNVTWHLSTLFISTALSGLFLGRSAARLRVYVSARRERAIRVA